MDWFRQLNMHVIKKIGATLAFLIGIMSVFAGSKVLLGMDVKEYNVLTTLVIYNAVFGAISIITAYFLWREAKIGRLMIDFVLFSHIVVFLYLTFFIDGVANESKEAMVFRISVWIVISVLSIIDSKMLFKKTN